LFIFSFTFYCGSPPVFHGIDKGLSQAEPVFLSNGVYCQPWPFPPAGWLNDGIKVTAF
jgi:hypothetical protein